MDKLINIMKVTLGTAFASYLRAHASHWNVEGIHFEELHTLFENIYKDTWESIDDLAEKIRQLDAYAPCSLERFIELSRIASSNEVFPASEMVVAVMKDQEAMIVILTEAFHVATEMDKQGLANFLANRIEMHSKWRWQLRATAKRTA